MNMLLAARRCAPVALLVPFAAFAAARAGAQQGPAALSLQEAIEQARRNSPEFLQQRNDQVVTNWAARNAYQEFLPTAQLSSSFGYQAAGRSRFGSVAFGQEPSYLSSGYSVSVQYDISREKLLRPKLARAQQAATNQQVASAEATLISGVTQQYLSVLEAQEEVAQAGREVIRTTEQVRLAQARQQVGAGIALDVRRAEVQQGQAELRRLRAENNLVVQRLQLGQRIGVQLVAGTQLTSRFAVFEPQLSAEELITQAIARNPSLAAARTQEVSAATNLRVARSAYLPSLGLEVGVRGSAYRANDIDPLVNQALADVQRGMSQCQQQNILLRATGQPAVDCSRLNVSESDLRRQVQSRAQGSLFDYERQPLTAGVGVSIPLYTGISRQLNVQRNRASLEDARLQVRLQELRLRADVASAVETLRTAYQAARLQERVRATSAEELRLAQERFRAGLASSIEVTTAQTSLAAAEQQEINAVYSFHRSLAALEALVGEPLRPAGTASATPTSQTVR